MNKNITLISRHFLEFRNNKFIRSSKLHKGISNLPVNLLSVIIFCLPTQSGITGNVPDFLLFLGNIDVALLFILEPHSHL